MERSLDGSLVQQWKGQFLSFLALFTSTGTLLCCALPALLVTLGLGGVMAATVSTVPGLITLSHYKGWVFLIAGFLIAFNVFLVYVRPRQQQVCEIDGTGGSGCEVAGRWSKGVLWLSLGLYTVGAFVTYAALPFVRLLE